MKIEEINKMLGQNAKADKFLKDGYFFMDLKLNKFIQLPFNKENDTQDCVEEHVGNIYYQGNDKDADETKRIAGKYSFTIMNASKAANKNYSAEEIFDDSDEVLNFYELFYDYGTYIFNEDILEQIGDDTFSLNIAIISSIEILPEFNGIGLGEKVLNQIEEFLSDKVSVIALKSFPKQFEVFDNKDDWRKQMNYEQRKYQQNDLREAKNKLDEFYDSVGFKKIKLPSDWSSKEDSYFAINTAYKK